MATPSTGFFPAYIVMAGYDHWPSYAGYINKDELAKDDDGKYVGLYPGTKYSKDNTNVEIDWPFRTQLYWTMRNGVVDLGDISYSDVTSAITDKTFTYEYYEENIENAFLENMVITNEYNLGTANEDGKYSADAIGNQGYYSAETINDTIAEGGVDRYTTYTWYNDDDIPVFQWTTNYGRSHEMTPDDAWLIAVTWFEHWTMEDGVYYYDGVAANATETGNNTSSGGSGHASGSVNTGTGAGSSTGTTTTTGTFTDVSTDAYYYDAVEWAVENGITTGTSDTTFSPEIGCSRAQIVTFLWRAAGSPETEGENPFTDVAADAYYYDAILWAVANGITNGTTDTTFSPDDTCTRGQIVTFLYRYAGASAEATATFSDVDVNFYYAAPVAWAVANGITNGTSDTTFSPDDACTRAQVVTFLYRYSAV